MIVRVFIILLCAFFTVFVSLYETVDSLKDIWIPFATLFVSLIGCYAFYFGTLYLWSLTIDKDKEYEDQGKVSRFVLDQTLEILCHFGGVRLKINGLDKVPKNEKFVIVYNHTSNFDPMIISLILHNQDLIHISKPGNFKIPIAGAFVHRNCYLSIDRDNAREALKTIDKAANFIEDDKFSVGVSPEGTRNKSGKGLLPFRNGSFKIALKAKCPTVVCCLHNVNKIHKNFPFKRTVVEVNFLDVIEYDENLKTDIISNIVRKEMLKDLNIEEEENDEVFTV